MPRSRAHQIVGDKPEGRPEGDFYPTPPEVTRALLRVEAFLPDWTIWEPACGDGSMSEVLKATGCNVISTDLYDHGYGETGVDFIGEHLIRPSPLAIVTNPPFVDAGEFIRQAWSYNPEKFCLLMKLSALEGMARSKLLHETGLSRVWVFRNRIQLTRNGEAARGSGMIAFAWYVWDKKHKGRPEIGWISTGAEGRDL